MKRRLVLLAFAHDIGVCIPRSPPEFRSGGRDAQVTPASIELQLVERRRDFRAYNAWQCEEVVLTLMKLRSLVETSVIHDWERATGRPRVQRRAIILCLLVKAFENVSYRRLVGYLALYQMILGLAIVPHFNTIAKYGREAGTLQTMSRLFDSTTREFWRVEKTISIDSTGLLLQGSGAWRSNKSDDSPRDFAKLHVINGTKTRATLAVRTTRGTWHDSTQHQPLLDKKPADAIAEAMTGDSAYWTRKLCAATRESGLQPYFKPKSNARHWANPKDPFEKMTRFARQFPNRFAKRYHERSTSESRNATEKMLFGDRLRSRRPTSRRIEVFARETVYNARLMTWRASQN